MPCSESETEESFPLLDLPGPFLLAVLRCCAHDQRSLLSAAAAHSRLHQVAPTALTSITASVHNQEQLDSLLRYLSNHPGHVVEVHIQNYPPQDHDTTTFETLLAAELFAARKLDCSKLPANLQLRSLTVTGLISVKLHPAHTSADVPQRLAGLTRLKLDNCHLLDERAGIAAALP